MEKIIKKNKINLNLVKIARKVKKVIILVEVKNKKLNILT
jgi:hypothetical protein